MPYRTLCPIETLTFLFTDIEGSTALLQSLGDDAYAGLLADHHQLVRDGVAGSGGREVDTQGDAFFTVFTSPSACLHAALTIQRAMSGHEWPDGAEVKVRMGIHTGEVAEYSTGLVGFQVHRAARVASVGYGGQVLLSSTTAALVRRSLPPGVDLVDLGAHRLKDLGEPEDIYQLRAEGLPGDFPPLRSLDNPELANNLPAQLTTFIGRRQEVKDVLALIGTSRLVTLAGAGGSGKTRLSLQVAAELLDGSGDGVWLVELASVADPGSVAPAIADALGILIRPDRTPLEGLLGALEHQDVLIVLDNCEHLIEECAAIADALVRRGPRVHILATSREPLGVAGETIFRVPSLSLSPMTDTDDTTDTGDSDDPEHAELSDAVLLFVDRVRSQGVDIVLDAGTRPIVESICRRLDGMPLAIELAAARLRSMSLLAVHERLDQRFRLLTGGSRNVLPRQQTLRAAVDWSFSMLSGPERTVLQRMSVFVDGFDLAATESVCGLHDIDPFDMADIVGSLVDKSLVVADQHGGDVRYRLLETIRQFGVEMLVAASPQEAEAVAQAHCRYFVGLAEQTAPLLAGPRTAEGLARFDLEWGNLRRAIEHAAERPDGTALVLRAAAALRRFWWIRHSAQDLPEVIDAVLGREDAGADPGLLGRACLGAAVLNRSRDLTRSMTYGRRARAIAADIGDDVLLVQALGVLALAAFLSGDVDGGFGFADEGLKRARSSDDDLLLAEAIVYMLQFASLLRDGEADELVAEALDLTQRTRDLPILATLHNNVASVALGVGDLTAARYHLERLQETGRLIGDGDHPVWLLNWGWLLRKEGDRSGARAHFDEGLRQARRRGDRSGMGYQCLGMALLATDVGDWHRAAVLLGVADALADVHEPWQDMEARDRQAGIDTVRIQIGDAEYDRLTAQGRTLDFDAAIRVALATDA